MASIKVKNRIYRRKARNARRIDMIMVNCKAVNVFHGFFYVNKQIVAGLSIDRKNWIEAEKKDGKFLIGDLLPDKLSDREIILLKQSTTCLY